MKFLKKRPKNISRQITRVLAALGLLLLTTTVIYAAASGGQGQDLLAPANTEVVGTFGRDSSFIKWVYLAEGIAGTYMYIRNKNPALFVGVPLVMVFTHFVFNVAS